MPAIHFHNADRIFRFKKKKLLKSSILQLFEIEKVDLKKIDYVFCSDEFLLNINKTFLQHEYFTDIITFPLSDKNLPVEAEIYISLDRVKENSIANNVDFDNELLRVVYHGALHLCGYKDKTKKEITQMRLKENEYLTLFSLA